MAPMLLFLGSTAYDVSTTPRTPLVVPELWRTLGSAMSLLEILYLGSATAAGNDPGDNLGDDPGSDSESDPGSDTTPEGKGSRASTKWGFNVQRMQKDPKELHRYEESEVVKLIKLSLGDEKLTDKRGELAEQIQRLQLRQFILGRDHILQDYLA
ncbi:uncharacterized protein PV07_12664 [Cladophialophora immunda]|uniref:Uncharacterized protein n=1 Tax=Cladophialophora immunda TaxID=569365 RepID=A0A0D1Z2S1_9EURO|nr:uncharacterized protein PV07_12664 [Cladophialophora immunda]KIW21926.1 hypothetical protein PV07_12664 [Cladophialophora immunda]